MKAFQIVKNKYPDKKLKLLIVGGGSMYEHFNKLAVELGIADVTELTGFIPYKDISVYHNKLDIYVAVSTYDDESFGVSILEASACGKAVVVSSVGGLPEVVVEGETGIIVPAKNELATADAIESLFLDAGKRKKMEEAGRDFVINNYDLKQNVRTMMKIYDSVLKKDLK